MNAADTFPAWLAERFDPQGAPWDGMSDDDRTYWEHEAAAVQRAIARGGFKATSATADAVAELGALPMPTGRLTPEREAEIKKFRDRCHPVTGILAVGRVHAALDDLLIELAATRTEAATARTATLAEILDLVERFAAHTLERAVLRNLATELRIRLAKTSTAPKAVQ